MSNQNLNLAVGQAWITMSGTIAIVTRYDSKDALRTWEVCHIGVPYLLWHGNDGKHIQIENQVQERRPDLDLNFLCEEASSAIQKAMKMAERVLLLARARELRAEADRLESEANLMEAAHALREWDDADGA